MTPSGWWTRRWGTLVGLPYSQAISPQNKRQLAGKAFAALQYLGQGEVVLLPDNTQYRMCWVGPARLMQNAVLPSSRALPAPRL